MTDWVDEIEGWVNEQLDCEIGLPLPNGSVELLGMTNIVLSGVSARRLISEVRRLREDEKRLDWLEGRTGNKYLLGFWADNGGTLREAIDTEMKESKEE